MLRAPDHHQSWVLPDHRGDPGGSEAPARLGAHAAASQVLGEFLIRTLHADSGRKVKARPAFYPSSSQIAPGIIATFLEQQDRLLRLMEATHGLDLNSITITSPVSRLITYSLMDAYRIIVVHEQNHFVQARRVMESRGFPGARADRRQPGP